MVSKNGKLRIPAIYNKLSWLFKNRLICAEDAWDGNKYGLVDTNGRVVLPIIYDLIGILGSKINNLYPINKGGKWGFLDHTGEIVTPVVHDKIISFKSMQYCKVSKGNKWGVVNTRGKYTVPIFYDDITLFGLGDLYKVKQDSYYGIIDSIGNIVVPAIYEQIFEYKPGFIGF